MNTYLRLVDERNQSENERSEDNFVICPKIFYAGLPENEIAEMQQIYRVAYEKAKQKMTGTHGGFLNGDGI